MHMSKQGSEKQEASRELTLTPKISLFNSNPQSKRGHPRKKVFEVDVKMKGYTWNLREWRPRTEISGDLPMAAATPGWQNNDEWDNGTLLLGSTSMFTRSFSVVHELIHIFHSKGLSYLGHRVPHVLSGVMAEHILAICSRIWTVKRDNFGYQEIASKNKPDLWRSTPFVTQRSILRCYIKLKCCESEAYEVNPHHLGIVKLFKDDFGISKCNLQIFKEYFSLIWGWH